MTMEELYTKFSEMFPNRVEHVESYKKIGSRCLAITFTTADGGSESLVFLYIADNNWHLGTKLWRKRPDRLNPNKKATNKKHKPVIDEKTKHLTRIDRFEREYLVEAMSSAISMFEDEKVTAADILRCFGSEIGDDTLFDDAMKGDQYE